MKRIIFACFVCILSIPFAFSQETEEHLTCSRFLKRIENNLAGSVANYNMKGKSDLEKLFFGDFNAQLEFCYEPSSEINPCVPSGFRIIRDSLNSSYILEVKRILNYREASEESSKEAKKAQKRQLLDIPVRLLDSLPGDVLNQIWEYNSNISNKKFYHKMYFEELPKHFKVEIKSVPISNQFAGKLYKTMVSFIDNFKAKGIPSYMVDGYSVTFRTVVDDEVWSLGIHMPAGNAKIMANLCIQIITDANANQLEEPKYLSVLNNF
jgi:hypothetical protein